MEEINFTITRSRTIQPVIIQPQYASDFLRPMSVWFTPERKPPCKTPALRPSDKSKKKRDDRARANDPYKRKPLLESSSESSSDSLVLLMNRQELFRDCRWTDILEHIRLDTRNIGELEFDGLDIRELGNYRKLSDTIKRCKRVVFTYCAYPPNATILFDHSKVVYEFKGEWSLPATQLPNRVILHDTIETKLASCERTEELCLKSKYAFHGFDWSILKHAKSLKSLLVQGISDRVEDLIPFLHILREVNFVCLWEYTYSPSVAKIFCSSRTRTNLVWMLRDGNQPRSILKYQACSRVFVLQSAVTIRRIRPKGYCLTSDIIKQLTCYI